MPNEKTLGMIVHQLLNRNNGTQTNLKVINIVGYSEVEEAIPKFIQ
jgi:hypothetical protein